MANKAEYYQMNKVAIYKGRVEKRNTNLSCRLQYLKNSCMTRSKASGLEFNLTLSFLEELYLSQNGCCAISGEPMTIKSQSNRLNSTIVSVDRIDNSRGYTQDNVQLVTGKVNFMRGNLTIDNFINICRMITENNNG